MAPEQIFLRLLQLRRSYFRGPSGSGVAISEVPAAPEQLSPRLHLLSEIPTQRFQSGDGHSHLSHGIKVKAKKQDTHVGSTGRVIT